MNYGKAIRTARSIADRSQEDVARNASINRSYLSSIEAGHRTPSLKTLENITKALEIPMHLLQLLGMEKGDISSNQESHVQSLALELTKLLLQERDDESERHSAPAGDAKSVADKEPARLGSSARHKQSSIRKLEADAQSHYEPFPQQKKKKPFQRPSEDKKKPRFIDNPSDELKRVQRRINLTLLKPLLLPEYLHGAAPGKTIKTNAMVHLGAKSVVKMDITSYFPNVSNNHVYKIWTSVLGCSPRIGRLLTRLTTCNRHLPQGAPTSSALANIYLATVMPAIVIASRSKNVSPSAYVDDVVFSGDNSRQLMEPMRLALAKDGLKLASKKRKILGPKKAKVIAGVRLGRDETRAPIEKLKDLRAGIHKISLGIALPKGKKKYLESIQAKLRHVENLCPKDGIKLRRQLEKALKPHKRPPQEAGI